MYLNTMKSDSIQNTKENGADKSLARPTSRYISFDGANISFDASFVIYINSTNIPPIMIINRIYKKVKVKVSHNKPMWPKGFRVG